LSWGVLYDKLLPEGMEKIMIVIRVKIMNKILFSFLFVIFTIQPLMAQNIKIVYFLSL
jgi:hypothetical protein